MNDKRAEPATPDLGPVDQLDFSRSRQPAARAQSAPRRARIWPWLLLAALVAAVAIALALGQWREQIGQKLVPDSAINLQIEKAQQALARGELSQPDGSGAREQFQAVLARDPDHPGARAGMAAVREAAIRQAREALAANDAQTARSRIALARAMAAPAADLSLLELDVQRIESTGADVADKLERARAAQAQGLLEQVPNGALALYSDVLLLQPDNALALQGRREILSGLLQQAEAALDRGDAGEAEALAARVVETDPSHLGLPALKARLGEVQGQRQRVVDQALQVAATDLRAGRLEAAAGGYLALLVREPDLVEANQGLDDVTSAMAARAGREAADFDFDAADASLRLARSWRPESAAVADAQARLEQSRAASDQIPAGRGVDPAQLQRLVGLARAAMRRGDLIEPPGEAAWDYLRQAAAANAADPSLREALLEYDRRARACFEDELASNRLMGAQACLDARAVRERSGDGLDDERRRLADRWIAFAQERLGANELALARRALESARALDPAHPGLDSLAERLARAGG
jgi:hypothetical protein